MYQRVLVLIERTAHARAPTASIFCISAISTWIAVTDAPCSIEAPSASRTAPPQMVRTTGALSLSPPPPPGRLHLAVRRIVKSRKMLVGFCVRSARRRYKSLTCRASVCKTRGVVSRGRPQKLHTVSPGERVATTEILTPSYE